MSTFNRRARQVSIRIHRSKVQRIIGNRLFPLTVCLRSLLFGDWKGVKASLGSVTVEYGIQGCVFCWSNDERSTGAMGDTEELPTTLNAGHAVINDGSFSKGLHCQPYCHRDISQCALLKVE